MKEIKIRIDKLYKNLLKGEYCQVAVPFARGELQGDPAGCLELVDEKGAQQPVQFLVTAKWPDGSVKYLLVRFQTDCPANAGKELILKEGKAREESILQVRQEGQKLSVENGNLSFVLQPGEGIFSALKAYGREYASGQLVGPRLRADGLEKDLQIEKWNIVEQGPVLAILEGEGRYEIGTSHRCHVRLSVTAGHPWVDVAVRLFNDSMENLVPESWTYYVRREEGAALTGLHIGAGDSGRMDSTGCGDGDQTVLGEDVYRTTGILDLAEIESKCREKYPEGVRTTTGVSNYKTRFTIAANGTPVQSQVHGPDLVAEANEHFAEVLYGTFMADFNDAKGGICATVYQAQQNFPKAIGADENGLSIALIPQGEEKVVFSPGMAREQRFLLHFHQEDTTLEALDDRSLVYQMPVEPRISPLVFREAGVLPDVVTDPEKTDDDVELSLIARADAHGRAYGMMNWGDFPDSNYTSQGRGGGKQVWTNNEYDYPHAQFLMYARSGVRRFLDYGYTAARHWMDVDVCHYSKDPLLLGGQWEHTRGHCVDGCMVCSHEWVEGLLDYWHFSGDNRALETALGIADNVLRLLDTPMYQKPGEASARETGWALRTLIAIYVETGDRKWLGKCDLIIEQFKQWNERYGVWLAPYTDNTVIRVGFMISVAVGSLMRYYRVFPSESLKEMMLSAIDDLIENFMNPYGIFYYKELPSLQRNGGNTLLLESMYIGYELTGDRKYLQYGIKTFARAVREEPGNGGGKRVVEDAVLVGSGPTKSFAQSFLPMAQFYNALTETGLIKELR